MINLVICGASGRMGRAVTALAAKDKIFSLAGLVERKGNPLIGKAVEGCAVTEDLKSAVSRADVVIDFTAPESTLMTAAVAAAAKKALVVGTTGLEGPQREQFLKSVQSIPVVLSPNMSLSANVLFDLVENLSKLLPTYDAEITEIHHSLKKDSPSGTAQRLAESVAKGRQKSESVYGRRGLAGPRRPEEIGVHALRGGDVVGDHTVFFMGPGERIEIAHRVASRDAFAAGALAAARWLLGRPAGLYDMRDVLGLNSTSQK